MNDLVEYKKIVESLLNNPEISQEMKKEIEERLEKTSSDEQTFMQCYLQLKNIVSELKQMQEPDVDVIIPLIEKGMLAYKGCEKRISKVQNYLTEMES